MREISVKFMLNDVQEERLRKITQEYKKKGLDLSEDEMFESIMFTGSSHDIDDKFRFHEWQLGLRESFQNKDKNAEAHKEKRKSGKSK